MANTINEIKKQIKLGIIEAQEKGVNCQFPEYIKIDNIIYLFNKTEE